MALYFDVGTKLWEPEEDWHKLSLDAWDALFRAGIAEDPAVNGEGMGSSPEERTSPGSAPASYVLKPVDGRLMYLRRGRDVRKSEEEAIQEADVQLEALSLHLSRALMTSILHASFACIRVGMGYYHIKALCHDSAMSKGMHA